MNVLIKLIFLSQFFLIFQSQKQTEVVIFFKKFRHFYKCVDKEQTGIKVFPRCRFPRSRGLSYLEAAFLRILLIIKTF